MLFPNSHGLKKVFLISSFNPYCRFINGLTSEVEAPNVNLGGIEMCRDMRRFEKVAEEKRLSQKKKDVDFVVDQIRETPVISKTEVKRCSPR